MNPRLAVVGFALFSLVANPALAAGKRSDESWGREGVSFDQYRADALECGNRAYGVEVAMRPYGPAAASVGAGVAVIPAAVWTSLTPGRVPIYSTTYVEGYRHAARVDVVEQLQEVVDSCLSARGYQRFRLTRAQMRVLRGFAPGTAERQAYLHRLGSDGRVLQSQAIAERRSGGLAAPAGQS
ncbi:hypothetical protein [Sphingosinicella terrae]|uniref:hypothetical protein n=1 Tax=Sphingosinicella terrae TaxID=2172047 RepID=UPI0013B3FB88|nr:hypothetical protein [Sphingosinicella terrae]